MPKGLSQINPHQRVKTTKAVFKLPFSPLVSLLIRCDKSHHLHGKHTTWLWFLKKRKIKEKMSLPVAFKIKSTET